MKSKIGSAKQKARLRRQAHVRKFVRGTTERPRLSVFRSNKHVYGQIIDDTTGVTLASASTNGKDLRADVQGMSKKDAAKKVGEALAAAAKEKNVTKVVFDRNGFLYWGRVAAVADGAREGGLDFGNAAADVGCGLAVRRRVGG